MALNAPGFPFKEGLASNGLFGERRLIARKVLVERAVARIQGDPFVSSDGFENMVVQGTIAAKSLFEPFDIVGDLSEPFLNHHRITIASQVARNGAVGLRFETGGFPSPKQLR